MGRPLSIIHTLEVMVAPQVDFLIMTMIMLIMIIIVLLL